MFRALVTIGVLQFLIMLVMLVRTKLLALLLGPQLVGVMAVVDKLLAVIIQTVSLSLPFAAVRFLPELWSRDRGGFRVLFLRMRNLLLGLILLATLGALGLILLRPVTFGAQLLPYRAALTAAMLGMPVLALVPFLQNAIAGRLEQNRSMAVGLLHAGVLAVAVVGIRWGGLPGYYRAYALLGLVLLLAVSGLVIRGLGSAPARNEPEERAPFGLPRPIWRFSGALLVLTFMAPYAALFVHYRLLRDHGAEAAGWMQAAFGMGLAVRGVLGTGHQVFLTPNVNRGGTAADRMDWANRFQATFCLLAAVTVPPLLLFPGLAVRALYSSAFLPGAAFAVLFVLTEMITLLSGTYQSLVVALDRMGVHVLNNLAAQMLVVVAAAALIGPFGILGAGLAGLAAPLFMYAATTLFLKRAFGLRVPGRVAARSGYLVVGLLGAGILGARVSELSLTVLLVKAVLYAAFVSGFLLLLTSEERQRARELVTGWRARLSPSAT